MYIHIEEGSVKMTKRRSYQISLLIYIRIVKCKQRIGGEEKSKSVERIGKENSGEELRKEVCLSKTY